MKIKKQNILSFIMSYLTFATVVMFISYGLTKIPTNEVKGKPATSDFLLSDEPQFILPPTITLETVSELCKYRHGTLVHQTRVWNCKKTYSVESGTMAYRLLNTRTGSVQFVHKHEGIVRRLLYQE